MTALGLCALPYMSRAHAMASDRMAPHLLPCTPRFMPTFYLRPTGCQSLICWMQICEKSQSFKVRVQSFLNIPQGLGDVGGDLCGYGVGLNPPLHTK